MRQLHYMPALGAAYGVEVLSFAQLREMDGAGVRTRPQRPDFHVLALVASGWGGHVADFETYLLREGSVVWIRPGMVHRWSDVDGVDGPLILFRPGFLPDLGPTPAWDLSAPASWHLAPQVQPLALLAADHLRREHDVAVRVPRLAFPALLSHLLAALVLRVLPVEAPTPTVSGGRCRDVFPRYRAAVEEHFTEWHQVADYTRVMGYDRRTLTRAARAATGVGAKEFLDQRILLEAKRLLAHTDLPVSRCAQRLGFRDAANFTTFFQRGTGQPPSTWRTADARATRPLDLSDAAAST
ncbi:helix-turn-helix domain-containing protein [Streptomyces sp. CA-135486]|uniref:helix-turn-helix domain-containing protein n=1 Tax=Streptomyces sp. CA-135486 TaxID=3240049 RepID=UPI003D8B6737